MMSMSKGFGRYVEYNSDPDLDDHRLLPFPGLVCVPYQAGWPRLLNALDALVSFRHKCLHRNRFTRSINQLLGGLIERTLDL